MHDISTRSHVDELVNAFYNRLLVHPVLGPVFKDIDLEAHLPRIRHFWAFVLLGEEGYSANVFDKHMKLPLKGPDFTTWAEIFCGTVDDLFKGEIAELAKQRATVLAYTFRSKWEKLHPEE